MAVGRLMVAVGVITTTVWSRQGAACLGGNDFRNGGGNADAEYLSHRINHALGYVRSDPEEKENE